MLIRSRRTSDTRRIKLLLLTVVGLLAIGLLLPSVVRVVAGVVLYPVIEFEEWFTQSNQVLPALWRDKIAMQERINGLEQDLANAGSFDLTWQRLTEENVRLRSLLGASAGERILATVVGRPGELPYDLIKLDQGSQVGIRLGAPVYIGSDIVIGTISSVSRTSSFATLFTTPDFAATVYLSGANVTAKLEGLGGGVARVRVPQGVPLRVNDLVHIPSSQPGVYGRIAWIESEPTQPEQYGYITPAIPINSLYQVTVGQTTDVIADVASVQAHIETIRSQHLLIRELLPAIATATSTDLGAATQTGTTSIATTSPEQL